MIIKYFKGPFKSLPIKNLNNSDTKTSTKRKSYLTNIYT